MFIEIIYLKNFFLSLLIYYFLFNDFRFDKDENVIDEPFFLSSRLEMIDKCRAVVMILSKDYMTCPISIYETKVFYL